MRNTRRTIWKICFFGFLMVLPALAQNRLQSGPSPAVTGPAYDVSVGYSYLTMPISSTGRANLNGLDLSGRVALGPRWGATLDSSYVRTSNVLTTPHQGYVFSSHTGPVFSIVEHRNTRVFLRALAGVGLVDGAVPKSDNAYFHGWLLRPSYAAGAGVEHSVSEQLALRLNGDYLRTTFYDAGGAIQGQNNLRVTVSVVFRLKEHQHRSNTQLR
jgi:opacity protein-like surface antigen